VANWKVDGSGDDDDGYDGDDDNCDIPTFIISSLRSPHALYS